MLSRKPYRQLLTRLRFTKSELGNLAFTGELMTVAILALTWPHLNGFTAFD